MSVHGCAVKYIRKVLLDNGFSADDIPVEELEGLVAGAFPKAFLTSGFQDEEIGKDMADFLHHDPKTAARYYLPTNSRRLKVASQIHDKFGSAEADSADSAVASESATPADSTPESNPAAARVSNCDVI